MQTKNLDDILAKFPNFFTTSIEEDVKKGYFFPSLSPNAIEEIIHNLTVGNNINSIPTLTPVLNLSPESIKVNDQQQQKELNILNQNPIRTFSFNPKIPTSF